MSALNRNPSIFGIRTFKDKSSGALLRKKNSVTSLGKTKEKFFFRQMHQDIKQNIFKLKNKQLLNNVLGIIDTCNQEVSAKDDELRRQHTAANSDVKDNE